MAATNINRVVITGNLTRDPELRSLAERHVRVRAAHRLNTRRKNNATGEWEDKPNYFDVTVWGAQGENCARYLSKGRAVALDGASSGASGRTRTATSASRSISLPIPSSSSVAATRPPADPTASSVRAATSP